MDKWIAGENSGLMDKWIAGENSGLMDEWIAGLMASLRFAFPTALRLPTCHSYAKASEDLHSFGGLALGSREIRLLIEWVKKSP